MEWSHKLKRIREDCNLSTYDVAKITGISQPVINKMETGKRKIDIDTLEIVLRAYKTNTSKFFSEESNNEDTNVNNLLDTVLKSDKLQKLFKYNYYKLTKEQIVEFKKDMLKSVEFNLNKLDYNDLDIIL